MNCKTFLYLLIFFIVNACDVSNNNNSKNDFFKLQNKYKNSGFALIYSNDLSNVKKLDSRSLNIYHKSLKLEVIHQSINKTKIDIYIIHICGITIHCCHRVYKSTASQF